MASASSPCAKIVCFLRTTSIFLPSPMVARNTSGSNPPFFLGAVEGGIFDKYSPRIELPVHKSPILSLPKRFRLGSRTPGVVTFEQFLFDRRSSMDVAPQKENDNSCHKTSTSAPSW